MFDTFYQRSLMEKKGVRVSDIDDLWYVTTVAHLAVILKEGIEARDPRLHYFPELPQRARVKVPNSDPSGSPQALANYVSLYLRPDNAALYAKIKSLSSQSGYSITPELCVLRIDKKILQTPGAVLTSRNPAAKDVKFFLPTDMTEIYPYPACQGLALPMVSGQTEESHLRQAEVLIPHHIDICHVKSVILASTDKLEYVKGLMHGAGVEKAIEHYPKLFFGDDKRVSLYQPAATMSVVTARSNGDHAAARSHKAPNPPNYYLAAYPDTLRQIIEHGAMTGATQASLILYPTAEQAFAASKYQARSAEVCTNQTFILAVYIPATVQRGLVYLMTGAVEIQAVKSPCQLRRLYYASEVGKKIISNVLKKLQTSIVIEALAINTALSSSLRAATDVTHVSDTTSHSSNDSPRTIMQLLHAARQRSGSGSVENGDATVTRAQGIVPSWTSAGGITPRKRHSEGEDQPTLLHFFLECSKARKRARLTQEEHNHDVNVATGEMPSAKL